MRAVNSKASVASRFVKTRIDKTKSFDIILTKKTQARTLPVNFYFINIFSLCVRESVCERAPAALIHEMIVF